jgi:MFS family permease
VAKARDWQRLAIIRRLGTAQTLALLPTARVGPRVGQTIDRFGGREVLAAFNLLFAGGLGLVAVADSEPILWMAWLILGVGTGLGLYDTAFATLGRLLWRHRARRHHRGHPFCRFR